MASSSSSSSSTQPPPDSLSSVEHYLDNILLKADSLGTSGKFEEAYELLFSTALANSLWLGEENTGWPLTPFVKKAELLEKALSFATNVSISFRERAIMETKVLLSSDDHENISEVVNNLKDSRIHGSFRWITLCLKQLLDLHNGLYLDEPVWPKNLFGLDDSCLEEKMFKRELSFETFFYCWSCLKKNMEVLENCLGSEFDVFSEVGKFVLSYIGVWNLDGTYLLLVPEAKWVEELKDEYLKMNGRLVSVEFQGWATCAREIWIQEMVTLVVQGYNALCHLLNFSKKSHTSSALDFTLILHIFEVVQFIRSIKPCWRIIKKNDRASNKFEKFRKKACLKFIDVVNPLGWDTLMTKDMSLVRNNEVCSAVAAEYLRGKIRGKDRLSESETLLAAQIVLCAPKLKEEVYRAIMKKLKDNKSWYDFIECYVEQVSELQKFLSFYSAIEQNLNRAVEQNLNTQEGIVATLQQLYMIERLLALTSLANGTMYVTKSALADWLVQHNELSISRLSSLGGIRPEQLEEIRVFFVNFLADFSENLDWMVNWEILPFIASRAVLCACLLHITFGEEYFSLLNNMLLSEMVTSHLPSKFREVLEVGRKDNHIDLKVVVRALKKLNNPLMIVKVKDGSLLIVYADSDFDSKDGTGDCFWIWDDLQAIANAASDSLPNITNILEFFDSWIPLLYSSMQDPVSLANKYEMRELNDLLAEMKQLAEELKHNSCTDLVVDLSNKILSRRSRMSHVLNQQLLLCQGNDQDEESDESEEEYDTDEDDEEEDIDTDIEDEEASIDTDIEDEELVGIETVEDDTTDEDDVW